MRTDPALAAARRPAAPLPLSSAGPRQGDGVRARGLAAPAPGGGEEDAATHPLAALAPALPPPGLLAATAGPLAASGTRSPVGAATTPAAPAAPVHQTADAREAEATTDRGAAGSSEAAAPSTAEQTLSQNEQRQVDDLRRRDREVRQHEQAHAAAAGPYAIGGASFEYTTGPDQRRYATGGEVSIDSSKVANDPAATIRKAQIVYRAALAPAEPSGQDRRVASEAKKMEAEARQELARQRLEEGGGTKTAEGEAEAQIRATAASADAGLQAPKGAGVFRGAPPPATGAAGPGRILDLVV